MKALNDKTYNRYIKKYAKRKIMGKPIKLTLSDKKQIDIYLKNNFDNKYI